jgi:PAS domain S-box-containing protein
MSSPETPAAPPGNVQRTTLSPDRQLLAASPVPIWVHELGTLRILDVNDVACKTYGYTRDEFLAMTSLDIEATDGSAPPQAPLQPPGGGHGTGIRRHRLKSGQVIDVEISSRDVPFEGRAARFVCPVDVTQRLQTEAALRQSEAGLRHAQALAKLGHVVTGEDGTFESWSETLPRLAGVEPLALPASTREWLLQLVHPEDRGIFRERSLHAARTRGRVEVEYRLVRPSGEVVHVVQVIAPIEGLDHGPGLRWFSTLQDVTGQKVVEEAIRRANQELEQRVAHRTAQWQQVNQQVVEARLDAERASEAKSQFLTRLSHELRTPLNAILGFSRLLSTPNHGFSPERQTVFKGSIFKSGQHLLALVSELLNLTQIEAGKVSLDIKALPLAPLLAECHATIEPLAMARSIGLKFDEPAPGLCAIADQTRLKQVLLNLLSNGIKYNRPAGRLVLTQQCMAGGRLRLQVRDTGEGMSEDQLAQLFQPFNRLGRTSGTEGTGLGLVVTRHLVELMGGRIGVDSTPDVGTTFWVELPSKQQAAAEHAVGALGASEAVGATGSPAKSLPVDAIRTILCVEDDPVSAELVKATLERRADLRLPTSDNGRLGLALALATMPDVILMDNQMPEMSGREASRQLAANPRTAGIPLIAISGSPAGDKDDATESVGPLWFRHVMKPFDPEELLRVIDAALASLRRGHPKTGTAAKGGPS